MDLSLAYYYLFSFSREYDKLDGGMVEFILDPQVNKTGDIWHICVEVITAFQIQSKTPLSGITLIDMDEIPYCFVSDYFPWMLFLKLA